MGYVVAANPLGQMIFSPLFGYWGNKSKSIRLPLLVSMAVFCIASAVYSSLDIIESNVRYWMFFSRFFVGVSSGKIFFYSSYLQ
jgi:ceroid-lipofuscinosis MFS transporter 7